MKNVTVLGSTGSIGVSTLDVIRRHPDRYKVVALTANYAVERMVTQCELFQPAYAVMVDEAAATQLAAKLQKAGLHTEVLTGIEGLEKVAALPEVDDVMAAIVGAAGLLPTLAAARAGKRILLANKESLVMSGAILMDECRKHNAELLPIDSEHNAIFQCMPSGYVPGQHASGVRRILLTASGGPFRDMPLAEMENVTPAQAVAHPNWEMGRKISVDSATMMNKGLEVIEACWLFNVDPDVIEVVVHRQSVIHSMVDYFDGSVLAQMGNPDMRTPIAHALSWPDRIDSGVEPLNLFDIAQLDFEKADFSRYPCLRLAFEAMKAGGTTTCILNAANEISVQAFLDEKISFMDIGRINEKVMEHISSSPADSLERILEDDARARDKARSYVGQ